MSDRNASTLHTLTSPTLPWVIACTALASLMLGCPPAEKKAEIKKEIEAKLAKAPVLCPAGTTVTGHDLVEPRVIEATGDASSSLLSTALTVDKVTHQCIPVFIAANAVDGNDGWEWQEMDLRTYGAPADDGDISSEPVYAIPGPTLRVHKAELVTDQEPPSETNTEQVAGTRLQVLLKNILPNNPYDPHACEPVTYQGCTNDPTVLCTRNTVTDPFTCPDPPGGTCTEYTVEQTSPECFHGADVTNLHYHGTHVSPQPHQDFVLLNLYSSNQVDPPPPCGAPGQDPCDPLGFDAFGEYQTDINPLPWNQPPGTHWYHPHKHGSTSLQVLNGLSGALLIDGEFDTWLNGFYSVNTPAELDNFETLLVVGQNWPENLFYADTAERTKVGYPPYPLVNGQAIPKTKMKYGEVQRWRFIGATVQASAQLAIQFPEGFEVKQIAQDGVQFSPENYTGQPMATTTNGVTTYLLAPGNRLDFLVKAPPAPVDKSAQTFRMTHKTAGHLQEDVKKHIDDRLGKLRANFNARRPPGLRALREGEVFNEALFTIEVSDEQDMPLPTEGDWPATPYYLRDIDPDESVRDRELLFSMTDPDGNVTAPGSPLNSFWINNKQYEAGCADESMSVGTVETWDVTNDSSPNHPFHIHINPFQLVEQKGALQGAIVNEDYSANPVWSDTIALPGSGTVVLDGVTEDQCTDAAQPDCAAVGGTIEWQVREPDKPNRCRCKNVPGGSVKILQRFEDYSGAFVLHCHFLGHEDRGMMFNVQTVCGDSNAGIFGTPNLDGRADDCTTAAPIEPNPFPICAPAN